MAFNSSLLLNQLLNTGLSVKDNPQYQLLKLMIDDLINLNKTITGLTPNSSGGTIVNNIFPGSFASDEFDDYGMVPSISGHTGSGVATQVAFWLSSTSLGSDSNLFWDNTNKFLGVGTSSPNAQLEVANWARIKDGSAVGTPTSGVGLELVSTSSFGFIQEYDRTGAAYKSLRISGNPTNINGDSLANVGIGALVTALTPTSPLDVGIADAGVGTRTLVLTIERNGAATTTSAREVGLVFKDANNPTVVGGITGSRDNSAGNFLGGLNFYVHNTSGTPAAIFNDLTLAVTINSATNVGIGTGVGGAINYKLSVNGNIGIPDQAGGGSTYDAVITQSALSPFRTLTLLSQGGAGGWRGNINFNVNYNAGAAFTALGIFANTDGITANIGLGTTSTNFQGLAGTVVTTSNVSSQGILEIATTQADGITTIADLNFSWSIPTSDKRVALIRAISDGATANNRGGDLLFYTKANAGGLVQQETLFASGGISFGGATDPGVSTYQFVGNGSTPTLINAQGGAFGVTKVGCAIFSQNNSSGSGAPGVVSYYTRTGGQQFIFLDTNAIMRVNGTQPAENGGACDLVGRVINQTCGYVRQTGNTGVITNVAIFGLNFGADMSLYVSLNFNITAFTSGSINFTISWTDETGAARSTTSGAFSAVGTNSIGPIHIRIKSGTFVTMSTGGTFVLTYNIEGATVYLHQ